jgi:chaperone modulatory protein CbpM
MNPRVEPNEAVLEEAALTVDELAALCAVPPRWVVERVEQGLIEVCGSDAGAWRFDAVALRRVRTMRNIERIFDAPPELAALVADLSEEIARLRAALHGTGATW